MATSINSHGMTDLRHLWDKAGARETLPFCAGRSGVRGPEFEYSVNFMNFSCEIYELFVKLFYPKSKQTVKCK